jgi:hypothetical protein
VLVISAVDMRKEKRGAPIESEARRRLKAVEFCD